MNKKWISKSEPLKYFSRYDNHENHSQKKVTSFTLEKENTEKTIERNIKYHIFREMAFMEDKYGTDIFEWIKENEDKFIKPENFLGRHQLRPETRAKMVDWMVEVFYLLDSEPTSFELAVHLMDYYISNTPKILSDDDIHLIGLASIYLSSKLIDDKPLTLSQVSNDIGKGIFSNDDIINKELEISLIINYDFFTVGIYDYIMNLFCDLIIVHYKKINELKGKNLVNKYMDFCVILSKLILYNEKLLSYKTSVISLGIISFGFDMLNLKERKKKNKDIRHFLGNWISYIIREVDAFSEDMNNVYNEILQLYKINIYKPCEKNKILKIRKKDKGYCELINLVKYYPEKLLI